MTKYRRTAAEPPAAAAIVATMVASYRRHSVVTDPGSHRLTLTDLPTGIGDLAAVVRGLVVHRDRLEPATVPAARLWDEPQIRRVSTMLERIGELDPRPLAAARPPASRLIGHCRSTSVLLCALLRETGSAARTRCGFSVYYAEGRSFYGDHWVTEYFHGAQWRLLDAELDAATCAQHDIRFDPLDVPRTQLLVAADAWQRARDDGEWGWYGPDPERVGQRFVAAQLMRDAASLCSVEVGAFDTWLGHASPVRPQTGSASCGTTIQHFGRHRQRTRTRRIRRRCGSRTARCRW
jgi:hypothetical protein